MEGQSGIVKREGHFGKLEKSWRRKERGTFWGIRENLEKDGQRGKLGNQRNVGEGKKEGYFGK